ncbi:GerMN domain-containing protein [Metabacillus sp. KIGAM252]|uniref:GerMN domain-containing protein n=1 Tax=Metabacillus flavus TaxID=2823519 RepID=A0ABS5LFB1_9BACI|nr:GerMN domain-containing protein [Metabacillus flavus]MBS2969452.1 GerMN domain-containing protein [Metabacillus flavus]
MKKSGYNEEHIQELLSKLPEIKDKRSRDEVYKRAAGNRSFKQRKIWIGPLVASFAALFILAVISPFWINQFQSGDTTKESLQMAQENKGTPSEEPAAEKESQAQDNHQTAEQEQPEASAPKAALPERKEEKKAEKKPAPPAELNVTFLAKEDQRDQSLVLAYSDSNDNYTIPVTLVSSGGFLQAEQYNDLRSSFNEEEWGLSDYFQDIDIRKSENPQHIEIHMNENRKIVSSTDALLAEIIQTSFSGKGYSAAELYTGDSPGIDMGPLGVLNEIELQPSEKKGFFKYLHKSKKPFFVKSNVSYDSFSDAYRDMTENIGSGLQSVMTEGAKIENIEEKGNELILTFNSFEFQNNEDTVFMLEALLLTAKEFNFETVKFQNIDLNKIGTLEIDKPITVPFGPNPVLIDMKK